MAIATAGDGPYILSVISIQTNFYAVLEVNYKKTKLMVINKSVQNGIRALTTLCGTPHLSESNILSSRPYIDYR